MSWLADVVDEYQEDQKEKARLLRIQNCGKVNYHHPNPLNGDWKSFPGYCHYHRECADCLRRRETEYLERLSLFIKKNGNVYRSVFDNSSEARSFLRKVGADNYLRCPTGDGFAVYHGEEWLVEQSQLVVVTPETRDLIVGDFNTPAGARITGNLGKPRETEEKGPKAALVYKVFTTEGVAPKVVAAAKKQARTPLELPATEEILQIALDRIQDLFEEYIKRAGGSTQVAYTVTTNVLLAKVDWSINSRKDSPVSNDRWIECENVDQPWLWEPEVIPKEPDLG